jgi:hypothetical protein
MGLRSRRVPFSRASMRLAFARNDASAFVFAAW